MEIITERLGKKYNLHIFIFFFPLFFVLMPRPPVEWAHYLTSILIGLISIIIVLINIKTAMFDRHILTAFTYLYLYMISISFSAITNWDDLTVNSLVHILKPVLLALIMCAGYFAATNKNKETITKSLLYFAYFTLLIQVLVGVTQLFGVSVTGWLYSEEKTRGFGQIVRITGTLTNPNIFAWVVLQASIIIFLFEQKAFKKYLWMLVGFFLVVFAGSRSLLIIFPFAFLLVNILRQKKTVGFFVVRIPSYIILLMIMLLVLYLSILEFGEYLPYVNELANLLVTGDLSSFNSYSSRLEMWSNSFDDFDGSIISWLFGLGAASVRVVDNDYLYSILNYGLVGTTCNLVLYFGLYRYFLKLEDKRLSVLGRQYIMLSLLIGVQVETLSGWNYPILIMFFAGICLNLIKAQNSNKSVLGNDRNILSDKNI